LSDLAGGSITFMVKLTIFFATFVEKFIYPLRRLFHKSTIEMLTETAKQESAKYILENISNSLIFHKRFDLHKYVLSLADERDFLFFEFGVASGHSINHIAKIKRNSIIYGFDSFSGLAENWTGTHAAKNYFARSSIPKVKKNVKLIISTFDKLETSTINEIVSLGKNLFVHIDCDTYNATNSVLSLLAPFLKHGDIIIFDDYIGYPGFQYHQHKSWSNFSRKYSCLYEYIAFSNSESAIRVLSLDYDLDSRF
jgi:hypothetical protein